VRRLTKDFEALQTAAPPRSEDGNVDRSGAQSAELRKLAAARRLVDVLYEVQETRLAKDTEEGELLLLFKCM
jgi:hypothetical protein